ncbi:MAG: MarR family transcriptional regulator [Proteobacteria bacterium]|nr:MarR family transcriptional regulator [Pseudomonadota bacterium]
MRGSNRPGSGPHAVMQAFLLEKVVLPHEQINTVAVRGVDRLGLRTAQLAPQQHQALLAIRAPGDLSMSVGELAEFLLIQPHSASELVTRLEDIGLVERQSDPQDRRVMKIHLTQEAEAVLLSLSVTHRDELQRLRTLLSELLSKLD